MITELQQNIRERIVSHPFTKYRPVIMTWRVAKEMTTRDANHLAAGVAYYAIFAIFPFILGGMVVADFFLDSEVLQREFLGFIIGNLPGSSGFIESNIDKIVQQRSSLVVISIIGLIWSSSSIFGAVNRVVNRAWNIYQNEPFHITRFRHLLSLAIFGLLFVFSAAVSSSLQLLQERDLGLPGQQVFLEPGVGKLVLQFTAWTISGVTFLIVYRFLPHCRVYWRHIWLGTLIATVLFESGKMLFTWYLLNSADYDQVYGSIASVIVFLFWVYLSSLILTLGAEICSQFQTLYYPDDVSENHGGWDI